MKNEESKSSRGLEGGIVGLRRYHILEGTRDWGM